MDGQMDENTRLKDELKTPNLYFSAFGQGWK